MDSSGSVFSETLQTITTTKLEELAKKRSTFEEQYATITSTIQAEPDPLKRLELLVDGAKVCFGVRTAPRKNKDDGRLGRVMDGGTSNKRLETDLKNLDRFLEQARYDPSISPKVLKDWEESVFKHLAVQSLKFQYADLYGKLVTEWLSSEKKATSGDGDIEMAESFEEVPGAKKLEARKEWEKSVFEPAVVDVDALKNYLNGLFGQGGRNRDVTKSLKAIREKVESFEVSMASSGQFSSHSLRWVIQGLLGSELLTNEKRTVLKDFLNNKVILAEIADVLNMRMAALESWSWGSHVPVEQRRKLNGSYNIYMHEDLLQAIFLHYIGVKWSVFFKAAFLSFRRNKSAWKTIHTTIPKITRKRREYYLGTRDTSPNLQAERRSTHRKTYFVHQLLDHESQQVEIQEGEEEAEFAEFIEEDDFEEDIERHALRPPIATSLSRKISTSQIPMQQMQAPRQGSVARQSYHNPVRPQGDRAVQDYQMQQMLLEQQNKKRRLMARQAEESETEDDFGGNRSASKKPMEAKQRILHLLSAEIVVNTRLHGELTCVRSVFESWNPLLPHATVLEVLDFFGVSAKWQTFFKAFLQAPLKFVDEATSSPRLRCRGTPGSHTLSDVFGEIILFCFDFSINQSTDGTPLYRLFDDFWFWSHDHEKCAKAWATVLDFAKAMSVNLNSTKTGTVRIARDASNAPAIDHRLPKGQIRWGFLHLDPTTGRFEIDQKMVDSHVDELRKQLQGKSKSVIDWIQAWNTYAATFFSSNFGKAANCFGREHVDKMLATHRHIQESIFQGGNVVEYLKSTIEQRFGVKDIPDGFLFFPVELGGLDLKSPFVGLLQIRESVRENPYDLMDEFEENERDEYVRAARDFTGNTKIQRYNVEDPNWKPAEGADDFFSFEEFTRHREEFAGFKGKLVDTYRALLKRPSEESIDVSVQVKQALDQLNGQANLRGITGNWGVMEAYWKWVAQMYGPEMVERFGGLNVVDPGLLPIGMVSLFRDKRVKWQG
ncbi:hypothetical protein K469DRAFT_689720 [Zopfia rhizophila CBS 207.26]|uniref:Reverse transcriptase domain-containing protein n=1 Tax=Zopfia rhizophila CBS 207.26 TaxID=1314779 RepID=A0A6A6DZZ3_9PEZI|nr:hypothetical protein K469DRAFT_689720 [Zopfia rhizophila CBS 207.26]